MIRARWLLILLLYTALSGCGFHLRGAQPIPALMQQTYIAGIDNTDLYYELENALLSAGARVVESRAAASATLQVYQQRFGRRVLSVDSQGRASEYELSLRVEFSLTDAAGQVIAEKETVRLLRDYSFDPDNVLASGSEEKTLRAEMLRYAARQMLRRLQSLANRPAKAEAASPVETSETVPAAPAIEQ